MVTKFANAKPDMIVSLGTIPTIAVTKEIKDVPVVFGMVYDPVEAGIAKSWKSSGNNTTGASPLIPMSTLVSTLKEVRPVKTLAVLYTADEKQSRIQLLELQKIQATFSDQGYSGHPVRKRGCHEGPRFGCPGGGCNLSHRRHVSSARIVPTYHRYGK